MFRFPDRGGRPRGPISRASPDPPSVFVLDGAKCPHGINHTDGRLIDSSEGLRRGLAQAAAAGGTGTKVLQLEAGWYGVSGQHAPHVHVHVAGLSDMYSLYV